VLKRVIKSLLIDFAIKPHQTHFLFRGYSKI